jgi:hypothetical protein
MAMNEPLDLPLADLFDPSGTWMADAGERNITSLIQRGLIDGFLGRLGMTVYLGGGALFGPCLRRLKTGASS